MPRKPLYTPWSDADDGLLRRLWSTAMPLAAIAQRMRRSPELIRTKGRRAGLAREGRVARNAGSAPRGASNVAT